MTTGRIKTSLLSLPDELLSTIFSEVVYRDGSRTAAFALTCRRLAPIVRQEVYRDLRIGEDETEFARLSELCAKRPDLGALVQVLQLQRPTEEFDDEICIDYAAEHPCITLLHSHFPALHTLDIFEANPADIFITLTRLAATCPKVQRLSLDVAPDPVINNHDLHKETWWHLLATNLAALVPNLQKLRLNCEFPAELETLLRQAPTSVTQLTLRTRGTPAESLQADTLAHFPLLERLSLSWNDATALLSSIRSSRIQFITFRTEHNSPIKICGLVDGFPRMKNLKAVQLDYMSCEVYRWSKHELESALRRDMRYDLAQVKASLVPEWPDGCSAEGLREVIDAARKNGIKVYGSAVDCLDWSDRFDEHVEHLLVDDASRATSIRQFTDTWARRAPAKRSCVNGRDLRNGSEGYDLKLQLGGCD